MLEARGESNEAFDDNQRQNPDFRGKDFLLQQRVPPVIPFNPFQACAIDGHRPFGEIRKVISLRRLTKIRPR
jgi:hypothetical protein